LQLQPSSIHRPGAGGGDAESAGSAGELRAKEKTLPATVFSLFFLLKREKEYRKDGFLGGAQLLSREERGGGGYWEQTFAIGELFQMPLFSC
jgi:hypothetical protein